MVPGGTDGRPRARDLGLPLGSLPPGPLNALTDVAGIRVGHITLTDRCATGVTAVIPGDDIYRRKAAAAVRVINGFGKAVGLPQVQELGRLETPILLTNTLSVGTAADALVRWCLDRWGEIADTGPTANPVVAECNDAYLNDARGLHVGTGHVLEALAAAAPGPVAEGAVGAGTGMRCYGWKGGIGTASRRLDQAGRSAGILGALVLANFGRAADLTVCGVPVGRELRPPRPARPGEDPGQDPEQGSVVVILATDVPLTSRQLGRVAARAVVGLARTGSFLGHGSGDFVLAFSTARHYPPFLDDEGPWLDPLFRAAAEATEESVLNALLRAVSLRGHRGRVLQALPITALCEILGRAGRPCDGRAGFHR